MTAELSSNAHDIAKAAKIAFEDSQLIPSSERLKALHEIRLALEDNKAEILDANRQDTNVSHSRNPTITLTLSFRQRK